MQLGGKPLKVKLKVDLTKYDEKCTIGQEGKTIPNVKLSIWGNYDRFVAVNFNNGATMDVLWEGLEVMEK